MTRRLPDVRRAAYRSAIVAGDLQAARTGRVARRIRNRLVGRGVRRLTAGLWR